MQLDVKTLSTYRLNRAKEDLEAAIRAVNILDGFDASKHSSVIAHFNQFYVHGGKFDRDTYKLIDSAYRIREKCDYSDFFIASKEDSEEQIRNAEEFVVKVENYLNALMKLRKCMGRKMDRR